LPSLSPRKERLRDAVSASLPASMIRPSPHYPAFNATVPDYGTAAIPLVPTVVADCIGENDSAPPHSYFPLLHYSGVSPSAFCVLFPSFIGRPQLHDERYLVSFATMPFFQRVMFPKFGGRPSGVNLHRSIHMAIHVCARIHFRGSDLGR
jgi:hypothetical protein